MSDKSAMKFARTATGYRLRIEGRGTMRESHPAEVFVNEALATPDTTIVVDLSACTYLDSTFLGCLIGLLTRFGNARFRVATPPDQTRKLFGPTRMDIVLKSTGEFPDVVGEYCTIPPEALDSKTMARHIMECHLRLSELPGPQQNAFAAIAQQMAKELEMRG